MKLYTRTGDAGQTGLFGGGRVGKDDPRVEAYGEVDELNAMLGWVEAALAEEEPPHLREIVRAVQRDLFSIGAHLATPTATMTGGAADHLPPLPAERVAEMEAWIDEAERELPELKTFILPGGGEVAVRFHLARAVCRRAERKVVALARSAAVEGTVVVYLNRLSDLLFTLARLANHRAGIADVPWTGRR